MSSVSSFSCGFSQQHIQMYLWCDCSIPPICNDRRFRKRQMGARSLTANVSTPSSTRRAALISSWSSSSGQKTSMLRVSLSKSRCFQSCLRKKRIGVDLLPGFSFPGCDSTSDVSFLRLLSLKIDRGRKFWREGFSWFEGGSLSGGGGWGGSMRTFSCACLRQAFPCVDTACCTNPILGNTISAGSFSWQREQGLTFLT